MLQLRHGDRLPTVATVQLLLNGLTDFSPALTVDGIFGDNTRDRVREFQQTSGMRNTNGVMDPDTWARLTSQYPLAVRDIVDVFDPLITEMESVARGVGSQPIIFGGGSNAVGWIGPSISESGVRAATLALLRFQGHGNRGTQVVGYGTGCHVFFDAMRQQPVPPLHQCSPRVVNPSPAEMHAVRQVMSHSAISNFSLTQPMVRSALRDLRGLFSPSGCIEFHGCQVAGGQDGANFLHQVADLCQVPVTAAQTKQITGNAVRFRGPLRSAFPNGDTLQQWAGRLRPIVSSQ